MVNVSSRQHVVLMTQTAAGTTTEDVWRISEGVYVSDCLSVDTLVRAIVFVCVQDARNFTGV